MTFKGDVEFSIAMNRYADEIYKSVLPIKSITRFMKDDEQSDVNILDKEFHIDTVLTLENDQILTLQEKFLRDKYAYFDCYTLEYFNNPQTNETGEWHRLCTDLYFTGYGNVDDGFISAYLFKVIDVKLALLNSELKGTLKTTNGSHANFYAYPFKQFKDSWFIYKRPFSVVSGYGDTTDNTVSL